MHCVRVGEGGGSCAQLAFGGCHVWCACMHVAPKRAPEAYCSLLRWARCAMQPNLLGVPEGRPSPYRHPKPFAVAAAIGAADFIAGVSTAPLLPLTPAPFAHILIRTRSSMGADGAGGEQGREPGQPPQLPIGYQEDCAALAKAARKNARRREAAERRRGGGGDDASSGAGLDSAGGSVGASQGQHKVGAWLHEPGLERMASDELGFESLSSGRLVGDVNRYDAAAGQRFPSGPPRN